jgi:hypothetical protein
MKHIVYHIMIPVIMPVAFFIIATTPVDVLGCRTRGLMALLIALISGVAALGTAVMGAKGRMQGNTSAIWWVASSFILVIPVIGLIIMA